MNTFLVQEATLQKEIWNKQGRHLGIAKESHNGILSALTIDEHVVTFRGSISTCDGPYSEDNGRINNIFFLGILMTRCSVKWLFFRTASIACRHALRPKHDTDFLILFLLISSSTFSLWQPPQWKPQLPWSLSITSPPSTLFNLI